MLTAYSEKATGPDHLQPLQCLPAPKQPNQSDRVYEFLQRCHHHCHYDLGIKIGQNEGAAGFRGKFLKNGARFSKKVSIFSNVLQNKK